MVVASNCPRSYSWVGSENMQGRKCAVVVSKEEGGSNR